MVVMKLCPALPVLTDLIVFQGEDVMFEEF